MNRCLMLAIPVLATLTSLSPAADTPPAPAASRLAVLNSDTYMRLYAGWKTPAILAEDNSIKVPTQGKPPRDMKDVQTPPPPANWIAPDFDDLFWAREQPPFRVSEWPSGEYNSCEQYLICARARFNVADPTKVNDLRLTLKYIGGAIVYLNGKELVRQHLSAGEIKTDPLAEKYASEAYLDAEGFRLADPKKDADRIALRTRAISELAVPASSLRSGINVLAIELHRAPILDSYFKAKFKSVSYRGANGVWSHVALQSIELSASPNSSITPNVGRPDSMQVWTPQPHEFVMDWHYGDPCEKPAIRLIGTRNGTFSGCIVVGSTSAVSGVKALPGDLSGTAGTIPSSAIRVRYGVPCTPDKTFNSNPSFDGLLDEPPAEAPVSKAAPKYFWQMPHALLDNQPIPGANQAVWLSFKVPADAKPGLYTGKVTVQATGLPPTDVPVSLKVNDWALPDPDQFETRHNLYQSHETTALYYGVPLWSDRHFELMGQALELSHEVGNRICMVHLIKPAYHLGNKESMIRWVKKEVSGVGVSASAKATADTQVSEGEKKDGGSPPDTRLPAVAPGAKEGHPTPDAYSYDFSIFDRYLDLFEKKIGKPNPLMFSFFHPYVDAKNKDGKINSAMVTLLDKTTGKTEDLRVPEYGTPESIAFWKPVFGEIFARLEKRGWMDVLVLGTPSDNGPKTTEPITLCKELWPDCRLMFSGHPNPSTFKTRDKVDVPVTCREHVWSAGHLYNPDFNQYAPAGWNGGTYPRPWKRDARNQEWGFVREGVACISHLYERSRPMAWRVINEATLQGNLTGIGRVGLDFWPLPIDGKGKNYQALSGSVSMHLGPSASTRMFLYPGPNGPVSTARLELFREGVQIREAMIFLQKALDAKTVDDATAGRINALLDERARHYMRTREGQPMLWTIYESAGLQDRDDQLFALCAEVAGRK